MIHYLKADLRKKILEKRDSVSESERKEKSGRIMGRLFADPHFRSASCVAFYLNIQSEVETKEMIIAARELGKEVLLPAVVSGQDLELYRFESFEKLKKGRFGILEPETEDRKPPAHWPEVIIVPGVAFGLCMHRLGYGRGYYDRLLAKIPSYRIGICFDFQLVEKLPRHEDDQRMNMIITERMVIT